MVCKTSFISIIVFFFINTDLFSQTFVPDDNFEQALIDLGLDTAPLNNFVPTENIIGITSLNIREKNILDLTGIEDFTALSILDCSTNKLNAIDVSKNTNLTELYVFDNELTNLDVSTLPDLKILWCHNNLISVVNTNQNPDLISLVCRNNRLETLNVTKNPELVVLAFENNEISNIDLSNNSFLGRLQAGRNLLTSLDVAQNINLSYISCEENNINSLETINNLNLSTLICYSNNISELDLSRNASLTVLDCNNNNLCRLNLRNGNNAFAIADFRLNSSLGCVVVDNPSKIPINWEPEDFLSYVISQDDCDITVPVDRLNNIVSNNSFTLPVLLNGNYFTETGGNGVMLNSGDVISTSQTIYIYKETICDSNETSFSLLISNDSYFIPKYFTPNNDGNHDFWEVFDNTNSIKHISIYNQYGKLLKFLPKNAFIWDGTMNGNQLPTNDYWYVIVLNSGEIVKGHFSLKR